MSDRASSLAPAKVNLALRVLGRRPDGYHDIDTLFQAVDLCDEVSVELGGRGVQLEVRGAELGPTTENLAYRAADRFLGEGVGAEGVRIVLAKRIPVGAGLGGGSSDAAAVLRCLEALLGGIGAERLHGIGAELGSDVPFFLGSSALARGTGRGEQLEPLPALPTADLVLVSPPVYVSTAAAYQGLSDARADTGSAGGSVAALTAWDDLAGARNDFEPLMAVLHPQIAKALAALTAAGASVARMTGSGSTCFGLFGHDAAARRAAETLGAELGWSCAVTRTLPAFHAVRRD